MKIFTHNDLVNIGYKWLLNINCGFAFKELHSLTKEIPDVIGFKSSYSILLECKVSRADFFADKKKTHKLNIGMGNFRFYICPENLISIEELPFNWGLIYVDSKGKSKLIHNPYCPTLTGNYWKNGFETDHKAERALFYSALRKLHSKNLVEQIYNR